MPRRALGLIGGWLLLLSGLAQAQTPSRIETAYRLTLSGLEVGRITEVFERNGERYALTSVSEAVGLLAAFKPETIRLRSEGIITAHGLQPLHFAHERSLDTHRNSQADFDWQTHALTLHDRNGSRIVALPDGTQDRLSAHYQFLFSEPAEGTEWHFAMSDGSKVETYDYRADAALTPLDTALGTLQTRHIVSLPENAARKSELWLATEQIRLPCKITVTEPNGDTLTQTLIQLTIRP